MTKTILTAAVALALTAGLSAPAAAGDARHDQWVNLSTVSQFTVQTYVQFVGLLLPAVQAAREAAR